MSEDLKRDYFEGQAVLCIEDDVDTDQIVPARFLKEITFDKMGEYLFYDARFDSNGQPKQHVLNASRAKQSPILIVGKNFGCGSSREHAPQALARFGFKLIIGESFAEIFAGNCKAIGVPLLAVSEHDLKVLAAFFAATPEAIVRASLSEKEIEIGDCSFDVNMVESHRQAFLTGTWDAASLLMANEGLVKGLDARLVY
eukprot:COSAG05_NODE_236_length_13185_cov_2.137781_4_plen_199_part_00